VRTENVVSNTQTFSERSPYSSDRIKTISELKTHINVLVLAAKSETPKRY